LVQGSLWLSDLRYRAWVPIRGDDDRLQKMAADANTLRALLDPVWLSGNEPAIRLLSECFGFDELDLRLLGVPNESARRELRNELAKLVELGCDDSGFYKSLIEHVEEQRRRTREVTRCRNLGLAVQDAVRCALEHYNLNLKLVDHGFDYEVDSLEDGGVRFDIGPYMLEVKATTTGRCRLTPTQAQFASTQPARYILCAVDLRDISQEDLDREWAASDVEPLVKLVCDIGDRVEATYSLVDEARALPIAIRNEAALRYEVPAEIWEAGITIFEWASGLSE
jgi:hypothetical protein